MVAVTGWGVHLKKSSTVFALETCNLLGSYSLDPEALPRHPKPAAHSKSQAQSEVQLSCPKPGRKKFKVYYRDPKRKPKKIKVLLLAK